jgi:hypothetical protein
MPKGAPFDVGNRCFQYADGTTVCCSGIEGGMTSVGGTRCTCGDGSLCIVKDANGNLVPADGAVVEVPADSDGKAAVPAGWSSTSCKRVPGSETKCGGCQQGSSEFDDNGKCKCTTSVGTSECVEFVKGADGKWMPKPSGVPAVTKATVVPTVTEASNVSTLTSPDGSTVTKAVTKSAPTPTPTTSSAPRLLLDPATNALISCAVLLVSSSALF